MELKELRSKTKEELSKLLKASQEKARRLRFSVSAKQLKNIREVRDAKKLIARIFTILKEKNEQADSTKKV